MDLRLWPQPLQMLLSAGGRHPVELAVSDTASEPLLLPLLRSEGSSSSVATARLGSGSARTETAAAWSDRFSLDAVGMLGGVHVPHDKTTARDIDVGVEVEAITI